MSENGEFFTILVLGFEENISTWMKILYRFFLTIALGAPLHTYGQTGDLERATPESQGVASEKVGAWFDTLMSTHGTEIHSAMLLRHGKVIGEIHPSPFRAEHGHALFSCSKTFTAAAIGIAIGEKRLKMEDLVVDILGEELVGMQKTLSVGDLLTMRTGIRPSAEIRKQPTEWTRKYLASETVDTPGKRFAYDSMATYVLSAIISHVTGESTLEYLRKRLFEHLHITEVGWDYGPEGVSCGGWGLYLQTESMAKFGQLLLDEGRWEGRQLIPSEWVDKMMSVHVESEGYGLQTWLCENGTAMRADGLHGQFIIVMPQEDMVAVITQCCNTREPGEHERRALFRDIAPTLSEQALAESDAAKELADKEKRYALPMAKGERVGKRHARHIGQRIELPDNKLKWKTLTLRRERGKMILDVEKEDGMRESLRLGNGRWEETKVATKFAPHSRGTVFGAFSGMGPHLTACGTYGWEGDNILNAKIIFVDWISGVDTSVEFGEEGTELTFRLNIEKQPFTIRAK